MGKSVLDFKIDTGAYVTVVPKSVYKERIHGPVVETDKVLSGPGDIKLTVIGKVVSLLSTEDNCSTQDVYIIEGTGKPLLGNTCIDNISKSESCG